MNEKEIYSKILQLNTFMKQVSEDSVLLIGQQRKN